MNTTIIALKTAGMGLLGAMVAGAAAGAATPLQHGNYNWKAIGASALAGALLSGAAYHVPAPSQTPTTRPANS